MQKQIIIEVLPEGPQCLLANLKVCAVTHFLSNIFKLKYPTCCYKNLIPTFLLLGFWTILIRFLIFRLCLLTFFTNISWFTFSAVVSNLFTIFSKVLGCFLTLIFLKTCLRNCMADVSKNSNFLITIEDFNINFCCKCFKTYHHSTDGELGTVSLQKYLTS